MPLNRLSCLEIMGREVEWVCESCWHRYRDDLSQVPGRLTKEVLRTGSEEEASHFLLSF